MSTARGHQPQNLYTLPGFKQLPKDFILTEQSKKLFLEGRPHQGFVGVAWKEMTKKAKK